MAISPCSAMGIRWPLWKLINDSPCVQSMQTHGHSSKSSPEFIYICPAWGKLLHEDSFHWLAGLPSYLPRRFCGIAVLVVVSRQEYKAHNSKGKQSMEPWPRGSIKAVFFLDHIIRSVLVHHWSSITVTFYGYLIQNLGHHRVCRMH